MLTLPMEDDKLFNACRSVHSFLSSQFFLVIIVEIYLILQICTRPLVDSLVWIRLGSFLFIFISRRALAREGDYEMMPVCACVR